MKTSPTSSNTFIYVTLGLIIAVVGVIAVIKSRPTPTDPRALALAQCLTTSGMKFYGASWCSHCTNQKNLFGSAASALPYVECFDVATNAQNKVCNDAKIKGYPTWVTPTGTQVSGEQSFAQLAALSGCPL